MFLKITFVFNMVIPIFAAHNCRPVVCKDFIYLIKHLILCGKA